MRVTHGIFSFQMVSYEVLMLTSKCEVCGLPDRGHSLNAGQFPCGHFNSGKRRTSTLSTSSGLNCNPAFPESPIPSPTPNYLALAPRSVSSYSPVKETPKSLLASLCRYWNQLEIRFDRFSFDAFA